MVADAAISPHAVAISASTTAWPKPQNNSKFSEADGLQGRYLQHMTQIFVSGSSGFIGRQLTRGLGEEGLSWAPMQRSKSNCEWINPRIPANSICIHLAALNDLNLTSIDPEKAIREAKSLALELIGMNFSHIVFASSTMIYGDKNTVPHTEGGLVKLDHPYARVKWEVENILLKAGGTVVRLANVYGSGMAGNNVFSDILGQLSQENQALSIRDGSCVRDFVHVHDVVNGFIRLIKAPEPGIFNLGSGVGTKTRDLARLILDLAGQNNREVVSLKSDDSCSCITIDCSKMIHSYQWRPNKILEAGISDILTAYKFRK